MIFCFHNTRCNFSENIVLKKYKKQKKTMSYVIYVLLIFYENAMFRGTLFL